MKDPWDDINCKYCGKCNRKGKPSAMKGSAHCQAQQGLLPNRYLRSAGHSQDFLGLLFGWMRKG